jgi:hypothetical protein
MNETYMGFSVDEITGFVRHVLTTAGGGLAVTGGLDPTAWQTIAGAVAAMVGVVWSVMAKRAVK